MAIPAKPSGREQTNNIPLQFAAVQNRQTATAVTKPKARASRGKTIVFVDGENFQKKVKQVFKASRLAWDDARYPRLNLKGLIANAFPDLPPDIIKYYAAGLHVYPETKVKSEELIAQQRALKS